ncbi:quinolinate synthase NadA [Collinsella sp. AGMB00827]|uniref:Quinolinate synthase n=1 Tax=Collinsella ureilytica TaxID=2869515 RepID=A0ABS7MJU3_9ACTN|nr:quinolinate synthase NadA [Collinsella urealyticum]MBY4797629.1 quinolinate synthase NadA [Collinsella urealyticum]
MNHTRIKYLLDGPLAELPAELPAFVARLKEDRDAVVLAHYYVPPAVQDLADYVGDSFYLAKLAKTLPQSTIVLAGVEFMGESAKLLNPQKTVLLPEPAADCPMAHMVSRRTIDAARERFGDDLAIACYVNSTVEVKSWCDVCVTSSNAVKICSELPQSNILFIPDRNLGRYVASQVPEKNIILNPGFCPRHEVIALDELIDIKEAHPDALVLAHPECTAEVLAEADYIGSTSGIIEYAATSSASKFIIVTVRGVLHELKRRTAGQNKEFFFTKTPPTCINMDMVTVDKLVSCLITGSGEVEIQLDDEARTRAALTLDRMLEYAAR